MKFFALLAVLISGIAFSQEQQPVEIEQFRCTMEYDPSVCSFEDISTTGSNKCSARAALYSYAAAHGIEIDPEKVVCQSELRGKEIKRGAIWN